MTKDIRTAHVQVSCDICGRTLLRGERAETYLAGGSRREVCELCAARARHEGWVREGAALERGTRGAASDRRRSMLARLRRPVRPGEERFVGGGASDGPPPAPRSNGSGWRGMRAENVGPSHEPADPAATPSREPRQVRAVPASNEQRTATALERFNASEYPRTVAGVARSLGTPFVVVRPLAGDDDGSLVSIVVSWELCWYRYEVDVSGGSTSVRPAGQGYELDELDEEDRIEPNAGADEYGALALA